MGWRDNLREASFRGVAFKYADTDGEYGRRHARHEYPGRDVPFLEDMGRKTREHSLQAYVLEPAHLEQARLLREACEKPGPGTLVHPYMGEMQVVCTGCRQRFTTRDGGMASFQLSFAESGDNRYPKASPNTKVQVDVASDDAVSALKEDFKGTFSVDGYSGFVSGEAAILAGTIADDIEAALQGAISFNEELAGFVRDVANFKADVLSHLRNPFGLADIIGDLLGTLGDLNSLVTSTLDFSLFPGSNPNIFTHFATYGAGFDKVPETTATRIRQAANQKALSGLVRKVAMVERIRLATRQTFTVRANAIAARDTFSDLIDLEDDTVSDTTYRALVVLRAALVKHIAAVAPSLPRVIEYTTSTTTPVIVLAHGLYGDELKNVAGRADEITARNHLRHPGMIAGGDVLEVLSYA